MQKKNSVQNSFHDISHKDLVHLPKNITASNKSMHNWSSYNICSSTPLKSVKSWRYKYSRWMQQNYAFYTAKLKEHNKHNLRKKCKLIKSKEPISRFYAEYTIIKKQTNNVYQNNMNKNELSDDYFKLEFPNKIIKGDISRSGSKQIFKIKSDQIPNLCLSKIKDYK